MATFLDILLLAALIVATTGNLISNFKGKKDNLFGKAAFPLLMLLIPAFYGTLVTQDSEPQNNHQKQSIKQARNQSESQRSKKLSPNQKC